MSADKPQPEPRRSRFSGRSEAVNQGEYDEFLFGLADRLERRAKAAQEMGDEEFAIEMTAASHAVRAADMLSSAVMEADWAAEEWERLKSSQT